MANTLADTTLFQWPGTSHSQSKRPSAAYFILCNLIAIKQSKTSAAHHPQNDAQVRYLSAFVCRWNSPRFRTPEGQQRPPGGQVCPHFSMDHNPFNRHRNKALHDRRERKRRIAVTSTNASANRIAHAAAWLTKCVRSHFVTTDLYSNTQAPQPHLLFFLLTDVPLSVYLPVDSLGAMCCLTC